MASTARFTPILLGTLPGGDYSQALVVNDRGQVAGFSSSSRSPEEAFWWAPGIGMVAIGSFGGTFSIPNAMNDRAEVVGTAGTPTGFHAFLWSMRTGLVDLTPTATVAEAWAINASGEVVGQADGRAFLWIPGRGRRDLGTLGGDYAMAMWITDNEIVVGQSATRGNLATHAFRWTRTGGMLDLGTLGGRFSSAPSCCVAPAARAANNQGEVVGEADTSAGPYNGFIWSAGTGMVDITPGGYSAANAINSHGQVAGWDQGGPVYWSASSGLVHLASTNSGQADAINDEGVVVGGYGVNNVQHPFAWTAAGGLIDLNVFPGGGGGASWISHRSEIAGYSVPASTPGKAIATIWVPRMVST